MSYLFTSESVSEGHPDKVADQISDNLLDNFLAFDPNAKVACETMVTTGQVVLAGEVKTTTYIDAPIIAHTVHIDYLNEMRREGFDGMIAKPLNLDTLPETLDRIINGESIWQTI